MIQTTTVGNSCKIAQVVCPNNPSYVGTFEDIYGDTNLGTLTNPAACMARAADYFNWCGGALSMNGNGTSATFYSAGVDSQTTTYLVQPPTPTPVPTLTVGGVDYIFNPGQKITVPGPFTGYVIASSQITIKVYGAAGGGGGTPASASYGSGGGGGGGGAANITGLAVTLLPGMNYHRVAGVGGASAQNGTDTFFQDYASNCSGGARGSVSSGGGGSPGNMAGGGGGGGGVLAFKSF